MLPILLSLPLSALAPQEPGQFDLGPEIHPGSAALDRFGWAVDADGDWAVVGSTDIVELGTPKGLGGAWVFQRDAKGTWSLVAELDPLEDVANAGFGFSVAIEGDRIAVGAPQDDEAGPNSGAVYLFQLQGASAWKFEAKLLNDEAPSADGFGKAVDLDADRCNIDAAVCTPCLHDRRKKISNHFMLCAALFLEIKRKNCLIRKSAAGFGDGFHAQKHTLYICMLNDWHTLI